MDRRTECFLVKRLKFPGNLLIEMTEPERVNLVATKREKRPKGSILSAYILYYMAPISNIGYLENPIVQLNETRMSESSKQTLSLLTIEGSLYV